MLKESEFRRSQFSSGLVVRLADDQFWVLPAISSLELGGSEFAAIVQGFDEAGDDQARNQAELALVIYLLDLNYQLTPRTFSAILDCSGSEERLERFREMTRLVAVTYSGDQRSVPEPVSPPRRSWWPRILRFGPAYYLK